MSKKKKRPILFIVWDREQWVARFIEGNPPKPEVQAEYARLRIIYSEVKLLGYEDITSMMSEARWEYKNEPEEHKPRSITHPVKKPMRSSAEWLNPNETTAICNECGCLGPTVTKNADGNIALAKAGWYKEEVEHNSFSMMMFGRRTQYVVRCPECDEKVANKNAREDWF